MNLYTPEAGDILWMDFDPQVGREQAGRRPAFVVTPRSYNSSARLMLVCPITSRVKGYPFELGLPNGLRVSGAVLVDHVKSADFVARRAELIEKAPVALLADVRAMLTALIDPD